MTLTDFNTVFWKEWKEIVMERSGGAGSYRPLILIGVLGVFVPFRMPPERFFTPFPLLIYAFFSAVVVTAVIADSFAGERERHTLETLLATPPFGPCGSLWKNRRMHRLWLAHGHALCSGRDDHRKYGELGAVTCCSIAIRQAGWSCCLRLRWRQAPWRLQVSWCRSTPLRCGRRSRL